MPDHDLNILVASSSAGVTERARAVLTANNWSISVTGETDVLGAAVHVRAAPPDLLLLDMTDPTIDPLRLVQELERDGPIPFPIVLLTSGKAPPALPLAAGLHDFVDVDTMAPDLLRHAVLSAVERASLRRELAASEEHFRQLADAAPVLIWVSSPGIGRTFFNKGWLDFTGRPLAEELGDGWTAGVHPGDYDRCLSTYQRAFAARQPFQMEYRLRRHDGAYRWLLDNGQPRYAPGGDFLGYTGACTDIQPYKEMEAALRASQDDAARHLAHLEAIYASAPVGLAFTDAEHRYTHVNERLAAFIGRPVEELLGRRVRETLPPELAEAAMAFREQVLASGKELLNVEYDGFTGPSGARHWLGSYIPVYDAQGNPLGINTVVVDVTPQMENKLALEETIRARTAQVRQLATDLTLAEHRERRRIARILHDDVQQKLYALQVHIHLLGQETGDSEAAGAHPTAALIGRLIDELIEDNSSLSVELSPPVISDQGLIDAIGWLRQYIADKHHVRIAVQTEGDVNVPDPDLREVVFQMVRELLLNVVYHAGVGEATLLLRRAGDRLVIRVEDQGSGFDPAAALAPGALRPALGLRTLRERADLFGGNLRIVSRPGAGARITLTMPAVIS